MLTRALDVVDGPDRPDRSSGLRGGADNIDRYPPGEQFAMLAGHLDETEAWVAGYVGRIVATGRGSVQDVGVL